MAEPASETCRKRRRPSRLRPSPSREKSSPRRLRFVLLVALPLVAAAAGLYFYLAGGRYISTDNAYVGAQKVLITPDVSGKISRCTVREGERVEPGAAAVRDRRRAVPPRGGAGGIARRHACAPISPA